MKWIALLGIALAGCQARTELIFGVATDIKTPTVLDAAQLQITRTKDGYVEQLVSWDVTGVPNKPFNLPGSYGVYSDGDEIQVEALLTGFRGSQTIVTRRAVLNLVQGQTLFYRLGLTAGCIDKTDCTAAESCVEGLCKDASIDSQRLPLFTPDLVTRLTCDSGVAYVDTATGMPMPLSADSNACPPELCSEGTCLKPPPDAAVRSIVGSQLTTFVLPSSTTDVPTDFSSNAPVVLVPDGTGGYTTIPGVGTTSGTFTINDLPRGPVMVKLGSSYYVTSGQRLDLGESVPGRRDRIPPTATTSISLQLDGMAAWSANDVLEAFSPQADTWWEPLPSPSVGVTSATLNFDSSSALGSRDSPSLIRGDLGDQLIITQLTERQTSEGVVYAGLSKMFAGTVLTQADGGSTTLAATLADAGATNAPLSVDLRSTQFDAVTGFDGTYGAAINRHGQSFGSYFYVVGLPGSATHGNFDVSADYLALRRPAGSPDSVATAMTYATPLPGTWSTSWAAGADLHVRYKLPGTSQGVGFFPTLRFVDKISHFQAAPVVPVLGPARMPTIDGADLFQPQTGIRTAPTIAWSPPTLGSPTLYIVEITHLEASGTTTVKKPAATFFTAQTHVDVPSGILVAGEAYVITIEVERDATDEAPRRTHQPSAVATIVSEPVYVGAPPARCGGVGALAVVTPDQGAPMFAFRRNDGAILLAHYGPGTRHVTYDPSQTQRTSQTGGAVVPADWAPDPCFESGHLSFAQWNPMGRQVVFECGAAYDGSQYTVASAGLFNDFSGGTKGTYGTTGTPGWGMIASIGSGQGRSNNASCGSVLDGATGGIAVCNGPGVLSFANHLVSYYSTALSDSPYVGCNQAGCNGASCNLHVWVWLKP
jgi:hypothetical protein